MPKATTSKSDIGQSSRQGSTGHIKRPPNSFILFRRAMQAEILKEAQAKLGDEKMTYVSTVAGAMWRKLGKEGQKEWNHKAKVLAEEHKSRYPDYSYKPVRRALPGAAKLSVRGSDKKAYADDVAQDFTYAQPVHTHVQPRSYIPLHALHRSSLNLAGYHPQIMTTPHPFPLYGSAAFHPSNIHPSAVSHSLPISDADEIQYEPSQMPGQAPSNDYALRSARWDSGNLHSSDFYSGPELQTSPQLKNKSYTFHSSQPSMYDPASIHGTSYIPSSSYASTSRLPNNNLQRPAVPQSLEIDPILLTISQAPQIPSTSSSVHYTHPMTGASFDQREVPSVPTVPSTPTDFGVIEDQQPLLPLFDFESLSASPVMDGTLQGDGELSVNAFHFGDIVDSSFQGGDLELDAFRF